MHFFLCLYCSKTKAYAKLFREVCAGHFSQYLLKILNFSKYFSFTTEVSFSFKIIHFRSFSLRMYTYKKNYIFAHNSVMEGWGGGNKGLKGTVSLFLPRGPEIALTFLRKEFIVKLQNSQMGPSYGRNEKKFRLLFK